MSQSIGDFAMNLIANDLKKKGIEPIREAVEPGKDLSKIKLSDSTINAILEQSFGLKVERKPEAPKPQPVVEAKPVVPVKKTPDQLLAEFTEIIVKARGLLAEMTSRGMIGTGPGLAPGKVKKKKKKLKLGY